MLDVHGFKTASFEQQPYGGHGYPGRTYDTLSGTGLEIGLPNRQTDVLFSAAASRQIKRIVKVGLITLVAMTTLVFATVATILIG